MPEMLKSELQFLPHHDDPSKPGSTSWIANLVYGMIIVTAIFNALEGKVEKPIQVIEVLFYSMLVLSLARAYAYLLATHIARGIGMTWGDARRVVWALVPFIISLAVSVSFFLVSMAGLFSLNRAFLYAKAGTIIFLFAFGMWLGRAAGRQGVKCIGVAALATTLGVVLVGINTLVK